MNITMQGPGTSCLFWIAASLASAGPLPQDVPALARALDAAIGTNDDAEIARAHERVLAALPAAPGDSHLQRMAAQGYVARADLLRIERHTGVLDEDQVDSFRAQQALWGEAGAGHASRALELATTTQEQADAYRLRGEATVHCISGAIAGMRYGPAAKKDILRALELAPQDPEALRAIGLMYLHNPPINGGDLEQAVVTFTRCAELKDGDVPHALLAQTWLKRERPERAVLEARLALKKNPHNRLARNIKASLERQGER